jgi:hypothetical protein
MTKLLTLFLTLIIGSIVMSDVLYNYYINHNRQILAFIRFPIRYIINNGEIIELKEKWETWLTLIMMVISQVKHLLTP